MSRRLKLLKNHNKLASWNLKSFKIINVESDWRAFRG